MKICPQCSTPTDRRNLCKDCKKEYDHNHYLKNKEYLKEYAKQYLKDKPEMLAKHRLTFECKRAGLTVEAYNLLPKKCSFVHCTATEPGGGGRGGRRSWIKDHDHKTGKFRGLLCHKHNALLGFADDKIEILEDAINYLRRK